MPSRAARRLYIDWARAIAVLVMIEAHTVDAWTRAGERVTRAFGYARVAGGGAAPLFLFLAGLATVLAAEAAVRRGCTRRDATDAVVKRGLEITILAFLFRLQAFLLSPGSPPIMLFRVDILNIMGPAIVAVALLWGAVRSPRRLVWACAAIATAIALLAPSARTASAIDSLPLFLQWYLRPAGEYTNFTVFPWAGFVLAGGGVGAILARTQDRESALVHGWLALAGAALVGVGFKASYAPTFFAGSAFWTTSPTFFAIRLGLMLLLLAGLYGAERAARTLAWTLPAFTKLGRSSLFVYWIHVELVYGYATWFVRGRLSLAAWAIAYVVFSFLMYRAILLRDRFVQWWQSRPSAGAPSADLFQPAGRRIPSEMA